MPVNNSQSMMDAICSVVENVEYSNHMGETARESIWREYNETKIAEKILAELEKL